MIVFHCFFFFRLYLLWESSILPLYIVHFHDSIPYVNAQPFRERLRIPASYYNEECLRIAGFGVSPIEWWSIYLEGWLHFAIASLISYFAFRRSGETSLMPHHSIPNLKRRLERCLLLTLRVRSASLSPTLYYHR